MTEYDVFISHVDEDGDLVERIVAELEAAGCRVWHYGRDGLPGISYLSQTRRAIDASRCFLFLISRSSLARPHQVDKELVRAHETGRHIVPILRDIRFRDFRTASPDWHQAIGAVVGVEMCAQTVHPSLQRLIMGLRSLGILEPQGPSAGTAAATEAAAEPCPASHAEGIVADDVSDDIDSDVHTPSSTAGTGDSADGNEEGCVHATFVHEHGGTGFLADSIVTDDDVRPGGVLLVRFSHPLLGKSPRLIECGIGARPEPVQYFRFPSLIQGYPVVLRVYTLDRLPAWSTFTRTFGVISRPAVRTDITTDVPVTEAEAGIMIGDDFRSLIPSGERLPRTMRKRFRTTRANQKRLSITPAVRTQDGQVRVFATLALSVPRAPAGVAWMQYTFRVDPDGRYTVVARDPLHGMRVRDIVVAQ